MIGPDVSFAHGVCSVLHQFWATGLVLLASVFALIGRFGGCLLASRGPVVCSTVAGVFSWCLEWIAGACWWGSCRGHVFNVSSALKTCAEGAADELPCGFRCSPHGGVMLCFVALNRWTRQGVSSARFPGLLSGRPVDVWQHQG